MVEREAVSSRTLVMGAMGLYWVSLMAEPAVAAQHLPHRLLFFRFCIQREDLLEKNTSIKQFAVQRY